MTGIPYPNMRSKIWCELEENTWTVTLYKWNPSKSIHENEANNEYNNKADNIWHNH